MNTLSVSHRSVCFKFIFYISSLFFHESNRVINLLFLSKQSAYVSFAPALKLMGFSVLFTVKRAHIVDLFFTHRLQICVNQSVQSLC